MELLKELGIDISDLNQMTGTDMTGMMDPSQLISNFKFTPTLQMKYGACLFLLLIVGIALLKINNGFIRTFGFILLLVSLGGLILFISTL